MSRISAPGQAVPHRCPACTAVVRATPAARKKKVRCPSCREAVLLESMDPLESETMVSAPRAPVSSGEDDAAQRIDALEARVEKLEAALTQALAAVGPSGVAKLKWVEQEPAAEFSPARADVLCHNLSTVSAHRITIQSTAGDTVARERARWFKAVFERAHWVVDGPEDAPPVTCARQGLSLATPLPVPAQAAAMFLCLRAAGFPLETAFDPDLSGERLIVA
jgi:hypothetical protein